MCSKKILESPYYRECSPHCYYCVSSRSTCRHVSALWAHLMGDHIRPIYVCSIVEWVITSLHILQEVIFLEDPLLVGAIAAGRHDRKWRVIKGGMGSNHITENSAFLLPFEKRKRDVLYINEISTIRYHHFILLIQVAFHTQVTSAWCSNKQHAKIRRSFAPLLLPAMCVYIHLWKNVTCVSK